MPDNINFDLEDRSIGVSRGTGVIGGARQGKRSRSGERTVDRPIEDNGVARSGISADPIARSDAQKILGDVFARARDENNPAYQGRGIVGEPNAGSTAAMAVTTMDGVAVRGAGDSIVVAVGDNGKVIALNKFHTGGGEMITNALMPGDGRSAGDDESFRSWRSIERELGTRNVRIAVMSDGVSRSHSATDVARDISRLIKKNKINFSDPNWSDKVVAGSSDRTGYANYKNDDRVVVSAERPRVPSEQSVVGAFDGIGSGRTKSAIVAQAAVRATQDSVDQRFGAVPVPDNMRVGRPDSPTPSPPPERKASNSAIPTSPPADADAQFFRNMRESRLPISNAYRASDGYVLEVPQNFPTHKLGDMGIKQVRQRPGRSPGTVDLLIPAEQAEAAGLTRPKLLASPETPPQIRNRNINRPPNLASQHTWETMDSPRRGVVQRADVSAMSQAQRAEWLQDLKAKGINSAQIVHSDTFGKDYMQVSAQDFGALRTAMDPRAGGIATPRASAMPRDIARTGMRGFLGGSTDPRSRAKFARPDAPVDHSLSPRQHAELIKSNPRSEVPVTPKAALKVETPNSVLPESRNVPETLGKFNSVAMESHGATVLGALPVAIAMARNVRDGDDAQAAKTGGAFAGVSTAFAISAKTSLREAAPVVGGYMGARDSVNQSYNNFKQGHTSLGILDTIKAGAYSTAGAAGIATAMGVEAGPLDLAPAVVAAGAFTLGAAIDGGEALVNALSRDPSDFSRLPKPKQGDVRMGAIKAASAHETGLQTPMKAAPPPPVAPQSPAQYEMWRGAQIPQKRSSLVMKP